MTRILLFGCNGQVGWELNRSLLPLGEVIAPSRNEADFSRPESLRDIVREARADIIVNAVAYTAVDRAESEEALSHVINADAPAVLAEETKRLDALLVHYSTDYVFDGAKREPYVEDDKPNPINAYGRTKLAGEQQIQAIGCHHLILRTSWVYSTRGENFVSTIFRLAQQRDELGVVADQFGAPTSARLIADVTSAIMSKIRHEVNFGAEHPIGIYHLTSLKHTSWHGFARTLLDATQGAPLKTTNVAKLIPIPSEQCPRPAPRPKNSRLNCDAIKTRFGVDLPDWESSLLRCLAEMTERDTVR